MTRDARNGPYRDRAITRRAPLPSRLPRAFIRPFTRPFLALPLLALLFPALPLPAGSAQAEPAGASALDMEPISPIPLRGDYDEAKAALGERLFSDPRLSAGNGVSCASCHLPDHSLADGLPVSAGLPGAPGLTNTLSLFNVGHAAKLGWDGQTLTLAEQLDTIIQKSNTMAARWPDLLALLRRDEVLNRNFAALFDGGIARDSVLEALAQYLKSLDTPNAPFDRYLRGERDAISAQAREGYRLFKDYGCVSCHQGVNVGGNMLQVFGIFGEPKAAALGPETPGSARGTGISQDRPVFRVPVLRNVAQTAPYFHDGSAETLAEAISIMARFQLGREISDGDIAAIEAFLRSLTGLYRGKPVGDM
ncbi:cytochrome c peroxidase [Breoghania sp. JC706]|uniref:cytochrome-c peroxidase n=1 Tax=Breoghania sp. JC706 TaxID=3117732 RepID=UPI00300B1F15